MWKAEIWTHYKFTKHHACQFGDRRSRDNDLGALKPRKNDYFEPKFFLFAFNKKKKTLNVESWNLDTTWVEIESACVLSLRAPSHVIEISEAENGQKWSILKWHISVSYNIL